MKIIKGPEEKSFSPFQRLAFGRSDSTIHACIVFVYINDGVVISIAGKLFDTVFYLREKVIVIDMKFIRNEHIEDQVCVRGAFCCCEKSTLIIWKIRKKYSKRENYVSVVFI